MVRLVPSDNRQADFHFITLHFSLCLQVAASKGLVHGCMQLQNDQGQTVDCQTGSTVRGPDCVFIAKLELKGFVSLQGHLVPPNETIASMTVNPEIRFVLVVEKEVCLSPPCTSSIYRAEHVETLKAVLQSLCSSGFTSDSVLGKSILITGKGYPDVATRELVKALCEKLPARYMFRENSERAVIEWSLNLSFVNRSVPMLCFVDADPHGLHIFLNYRNGSKAMSFDNTNLTASRLQWLGLSAEDMLRC